METNNYEISEWQNPNDVTLDMAKRLIAYKQKITEEWFEKKNNETKNESDNETLEDQFWED